MKATYYRQDTQFTCGPAVIRMILAQKEVFKKEKLLARQLKTSPRTGTSRESLAKVLRQYGYEAAVKESGSLRDVQKCHKRKEIVIVNYYLKKEKEGHYALLKKIDAHRVYLADPWKGDNTVWSKRYFRTIWHDSKKKRGCYIVVHP